jgi:hypothetical protein
MAAVVHERLGIDLAVHRDGGKFAERTDRDVGRAQRRLGRVQAGAGDVVMEGEDIGRRGEPRLQNFKCRQPGFSDRPAAPGRNDKVERIPAHGYSLRSERVIHQFQSVRAERTTAGRGADKTNGQ